MKCPSSIFSFKTLRGFVRPGRAVWLAVGLILGAEGLVRWAGVSGHLPPPRSLDEHVSHQLARTRETEGAIWLVGNSTLGYGVDTDELQRTLGRPVVALIHGSTTARGSVAMVDYYLRNGARKPSRIVMCMTKDDLNVNGERAAKSKRYLLYGSWRSLSLERALLLARSREDIKSWIQKRGHLAPARKEDDDTDVRARKEDVFTGKLNTGDRRWLHQLAESYAPDASSLDRLASISKSHDARVAVLWMPVTDVYLRHHDQMAPECSWSQIQTAVRERCTSLGIEVWDLHGPFSEYAGFRDAYHLGESGRAEFNQKLIEKMKPAPGSE